jgi:hypothetical protein
VNQIRLYVDEDATQSRLVAALRLRAVAVVTVLDVQRFGRSDEDQLAFATGQGYVLYTFNVADFHRIHLQWRNAGREHAGMILAQQQRFPIGEQLRRILRLRAAVSSEGIRNQVEFLSDWG